jgi:hypothetical protein
VLISFGVTTIKVVKWWPETKEVAYFKIGKRGAPIGSVIEESTAKLERYLSKHATGARVIKVAEIGKGELLVWK